MHMMVNFGHLRAVLAFPPTPIVERPKRFTQESHNLLPAFQCLGVSRVLLRTHGIR